jgi:prolyl-tRNA synthetase
LCGGVLIFQTSIEVGHIFNFGSFYSEPLGATFLDEDGQEKLLLGGSYGIGPGRVMAAIVEQHNDEYGISWPASVAPYDVHVVAIGAAGAEAMETADEIVAALEEAGRSVLLDDRDGRPGEKFADADLVGCPVRLTVGKKTLEDGQVDVLVREGRAEERVLVGEISARVGGLLDGA